MELSVTHSLQKASASFRLLLGNTMLTFLLVLRATSFAAAQHIGPEAQMDDNKKAHLLAQAKFLRAFCYFYLVTTFGDVPLHLSFNTDNKGLYGLDLWPGFARGFLEGNEYGRETIMVIDHNKDLKFDENSRTGTGATNLKENKSNFFFRPNYPTVNANYPAAGGAYVCVRDVQNGRPWQRIRPNMRYVLEVAFANRATDSRYDGTFQTINHQTCCK